MTKKRLITLIITIVISASLIAYGVFTNNSQVDKTSDRSLGNLVEQLNDLRNLKQECLDNLNYLDTIKQAKGMTGYCDSWDEEIISTREEVNRLQEKPYDKVRGLMQSR